MNDVLFHHSSRQQYGYVHHSLFYRTYCIFCRIYIIQSGFGGLGVSVLAFGTQFRRFKPGQSRRIFKGEKILSTPSKKVKPSVPCHRFAVCKRSLELHGSRILRQNLSEHFLPTKSSTFFSWRSFVSDVKVRSGEGGNV
jgi:hypothetical protein